MGIEYKGIEEKESEKVTFREMAVGVSHWQSFGICSF
jgi:hypothetical protein